tara:strand:- start:158 stop:577 length:420 start_codon:yes stop_codon:yes gene_type:complete
MVEAIVVLSLLFTFSLFVNIFLFWYTRTTLSSLLFISENYSFLKSALDAYAKHLKSVYQLEIYYGDETIKSLFEHTTGLLDKISEFDDVISLSDEQELILDDREIEIIRATEEEETPEASIGSAKEKHVFYGGTRRRDN